MPSTAGDPIHQDDKDQLWYFWDETGAYRYGPFNSRKAAEAVLTRYAEYLNHNSKLMREFPSGVKPGTYCGHSHDCLKGCGDPHQKMTTENFLAIVMITAGSVMSFCIIFVFMYGVVQLARRLGWLL